MCQRIKKVISVMKAFLANIRVYSCYSKGIWITSTSFWTIRFIYQNWNRWAAEGGNRSDHRHLRFAFWPWDWYSTDFIVNQYEHSSGMSLQFQASHSSSIFYDKVTEVVRKV
jgi:hypothetical protein